MTRRSSAWSKAWANLRAVGWSRSKRCFLHFHRNVMNKVPPSRKADVVKAIQAQEFKRKASEITEELKEMKFRAAAEILFEGIGETVTYYRYPRKHHRSIHTNNMLERVIKEIRRRTSVVGSFPDGKAPLC